MQTYEKRLPHRKIYGIPKDDGTYQIISDCNFLPDAVIRMNVDAASAISYFEDTGRKPVQEIFPDLLKEQREILITGMSPAEWDAMFNPPLPATEQEFKEKYAAFGYCFD